MGYKKVTDSRPESLDLAVYKDLFKWEKPGWHSLALCSKRMYKLFMNDGVTTIWFGNSVKQRHAKTICRMCPVRWTCLETNLEEPEGVFGGLDKKERKRLRLLLLIKDRSTIQHIVETEFEVKHDSLRNRPR